MIDQTKINAFLNSVVFHRNLKQCIQSVLNAVKAVDTDPYGVCIFCEPGTGKTMLGDYCALKLNEASKVTRERKEIRAIKINLEEGALVTDVKRSIIYKITNVYPNGYTRQFLNNYLLKQLQVAGVKIIIIDEFHHLLRGEKKIDQKVGQFVKSLISTYGVSVLLLGVPRAKKILELDRELFSRVVYGGVLNLLNCRTDESKAYFCEFLRVYSVNFPTPIIDLSTENIAYRMELATGGDLRRIRLLFQQVLLTVKDNEKVTLEHLDEAHRSIAPPNLNTQKKHETVWPFSKKTSLKEVKTALTYE